MQKGRKVSNFVLNELIGRGGFGEVWAAISITDYKPVAIKIEPITSTRKLLSDESAVLSKLADSQYFPHFIYSWEDSEATYLAMELLESTVRKTTEAAFGCRLSLKQGAALGLQMLSAIEDLHKHGFVHRDIKPSNFMYRPGNSPPDVCLIDFGLAKVWRNNEGVIIPQRYGIGFRGTCRYASLNSHDGADLSCRDDLWSFLYIVVEMVAPPLPWHNQTDKDIVATIKRESTKKLLADLPKQFQELFDYVQQLRFEDIPDYDLFRTKLEEIRKIGENDEVLSYFPFSQISSCNVSSNQKGANDSSPVAFSDDGDNIPIFERSFAQEIITEKERSDYRCCLLL